LGAKERSGEEPGTCWRSRTSRVWSCASGWWKNPSESWSWCVFASSAQDLEATKLERQLQLGEEISQDTEAARQRLPEAAVDHQQHTAVNLQNHEMSKAALDAKRAADLRYQQEGRERLANSERLAFAKKTRPPAYASKSARAALRALCGR